MTISLNNTRSFTFQSLCFCIVVLLLFQCKSPLEEIRSVEKAKFNFSYNLDEPDSRNFLDHRLEEISGLTISKNDKDLFSLNDEEGKIYILNEEQKVADVVPFGKRGDYEGIENVHGDLYVLKSSGTLLLIDLDKKEIEKKFKTSLNQRNDVEGLGFDKRDSTLLLACKAQAGIEKKIEEARAVYKFNLDKHKLNETPFLLITDNAIESFLIKNRPKNEGTARDNLKFKNLLQRASHFSPSAIAVHPITNHYYLLSAVSKLLFVVDENSKILNVSFLDTGIFTQPEGISFSSNGTLYIANEAAKSKASVVVFNMID